MRIGIDLGGTKTEGIAMDEDGEIVTRVRRDTPSGDYRATLNSIASLIGEIENTVSARCTIGIGTPGSISPTSGRLRNSNSVCLNDQHLHQDLEGLLGRQVRIVNDADCFALSEATDGAAAGAHSVFGVIIGTGTGDGIVISGQLVSRPNGVAANGATTHSPGLSRQSFQVLTVIAESRAASRPFSRVPGSPGAMPPRRMNN